MNDEGKVGDQYCIISCVLLGDFVLKLQVMPPDVAVSAAAVIPDRNGDIYCAARENAEQRQPKKSEVSPASLE